MSVCVLPFAAVADIAQCNRLTLAHHAGVDNNRNIGGGVVSSEVWSSIYHNGFGGSSRDLLIVSCGDASGLLIALGRNEYDVSDMVLARFQSLVDSTVNYTFDDLAEDLGSISRSVERLDKIADQPCGCAVVYPRAGNFQTAFALDDLR